MRIIAGSLKGRTLGRAAPGVRPTTDRLREALFSVLGDRVPGSVWVDAFAGSGAVGLEALSRGARHVIFNDRSARVRKDLRANLQRFRVAEGFEIHGRETEALFRRLPDRAVDFVFLDPPYELTSYSRLLKSVLEALAESSPEHTVLLEVSARTSSSTAPEELYRMTRRLRAGDSHILILKPALPGPGGRRPESARW